MPAEGFLQRFHDLAEPSEEARLRAAVAVRRALGPRPKAAAAPEGDGAAPGGEDLAYAVRRLVRGSQSARRCCRQGFSLALAEVLEAFPEELAAVLQLVKQFTELQSGLKNAELKERLVGRLCVYAAIFEAGCLRRALAPEPGRGRSAAQQKVVAELGRGLHEIYAARPFLREPAVRMAAHVCRELCAAGHFASVPELFAEWSLDEKVRSGDAEACLPGLALELRAAYEEALRAPQAGAKALAAWPACVRDGAGLAQPAALRRLAETLSAALTACALWEPLPFALRPFCRWLLRAKGAAPIWPAMDEALFPERAAPLAQARGLRALGEVVAELCAERAESKAEAESLLTSFFEEMGRGLKLMLQMLSWPRAQTHAAAVFAQRRLLEAVGAPQAPPPAPARKGGQKAAAGAPDAAPPAPAWPLGDSARLAILGALQQQKGFLTLPGASQRQWQQALLAPLSPPGIRVRCASLLAGPSSAGRGEAGEEDGAHGNRLCAAQLEQLAVHAHAPDEVILAVLFRFLTAAYFAPAAAEEAGAGRSMREFCAWAGVSVAAEGEDMAIPVSSPAGGGAEGRAPWRTKFWSILAGFSRRTLPEMAAKVVAQGPGAAEASDLEEVQAGSSSEHTPSVKTLAFTGLLSDGSLLLMRLHEWWAFVTEQTSPPTASPKKKRRSGSGLRAGQGGLQCMVPLEAGDLDLRAKCLECCRGLAGDAEGEAALTQRQRNAVCGFLLSLLLVLLTSEDAEEKASLRSTLEEALSALSEVPAPAPASATPKKRARAQQQRAQALAALPRIAAELFVDAAGLVREAARAAWRELGDFASEETLAGLGEAVRGAGGEAEAEEEEEPEAEAEAQGAGPAPAGPGGSEPAGEAPARPGGAAGGEPGGEDEAEELLLEGDALWEQLLGEGEGEGEGAGGSLLAAFAASGLEGGEGPKLSKWQQRLRREQEDVARRFREVELLEAFVSRFAEKRPVAMQVMQELYEALLAAGRRASGHAKHGKEGEAEKGSKGKRKMKADTTVRRLHTDLAQRIAKVLAKALKKVRGAATVQAVSRWHPAEEWATRARAVATLAGGAKAAALGPRAVEVGAALLHFLCSAHRAAALGPGGGGDEEGWDLAKELLLGALQDWGGKRECERWCAALLAAFAVRTPRVLLGLPWLETIRACGKPFVQRTQLAFVAGHLLRSAPAEDAGGAWAGLAAGFAELCAELLEGTLGDAAPGAAAQKQKLRREALRALKLALRTGRPRPGEAAVEALAPGGASAKRVVAVVAKVRDALPGRRGEAYQLCLHVLRSAGPAGAGGGRRPQGGGPPAGGPGGAHADEGSGSRAGKRSRPPRSEEPPAAKRQTQAPGAKGHRGLFEDM